MMTDLSHNRYVADILKQPDDLEDFLARFDPGSLRALAQAVAGGRYRRIILTGMGSSLHAAYPAWLQMAQAGLPVSWVNASELLHYARALITADTLVWLVSQSGRTVEVCRLLEALPNSSGPDLLATTNDLVSPLAARAGLTVPIHAGPEGIVSSRTYMNTLAAVQLTALVLSGRDISGPVQDLQKTVQAMRAYLQSWAEHVDRAESLLGTPNHLVLTGRGPSMAAVHHGGLIIGEAAKVPVVPYQAAEFNHGQVEVAGSDLTVAMLAGAPETQAMNSSLLKALAGYGSRVIWIGADPAEDLAWLPMPPAQGIGLPIAEMLSIQIVSLALARQAGIEAGACTRVPKVTTLESSISA
jgi:glucosamine--fructose-6-phosphate aminotransferase (isomerizing)